MSDGTAPGHLDGFGRRPAKTWLTFRQSFLRHFPPEQLKKKKPAGVTDGGFGECERDEGKLKVQIELQLQVIGFPSNQFEALFVFQRVRAVTHDFPTNRIRPN
jgi:hypothetical protein